ncbi:MAG: GNAT family N-acetyltransferase [Candidatus Omnitrophica bacterium]|nr:GNAT family N-acetyltransferase [Candidatus Omnitrophota bacterium]MBU1923985.1 GNAT family N-acetyltransferase [Candidatus Omnitrophota bacterium]
MAKITCKIYDNIEKIDKKDWDAVFGEIPESYPFYKVLEKSELAEFVFYYLVIYRNNEVVLISPLFSADFNLDIAVEGPLLRVIRLIRKIFPRFLVFKTLFCGSPFGEYGVMGIRDDFRLDPELIPQLLAGIKYLALKLGTPLTIFKDFLKDSTLLLDALKRKGFTRVESFPTVLLDLSFSSFAEYLKSLGRSTRKSLSKKLKQAYSRGNIEVKAVQEISGQIDQIIQLYENTYHGGSTKFERLNKKFFLQVSEDLSPHTLFFLYYADGCLAAFNLCFIYKDLLIDKFIGFNYDISNHYNLYFVSWAHNIKWCIDNSLRYYHPGQTDYEPKVRLGGKIIPLYAYLRHSNVFFNFLLKLLVVLLKPDNFDEDIRK